MDKYRRIVIFDGDDGPEFRVYHPRDPEPLFAVHLQPNELLKLSVEMLSIYRRLENRKEMESYTCD